MKISIAMATFNGEKYLREQLESFSNQTLLPDELIVCDDGSEDKTLDLLYKFKERSKFNVAIFENKKNIGYSKNFEKALSLCGGDLIFLSDQDDVWFPEKIRMMSEELVCDDKVFVLQGDLLLADQNLKPYPMTQLESIVSAGYKPDKFITGCGTAIKKDWLRIALPIPSEIVAHDYWIHNIAIPLNVRKILSTPYQFFRRHKDNTSDWRLSKKTKFGFLDSFMTYGGIKSTAKWRRENERVRMVQSRIKDETETLKALNIHERQGYAVQYLGFRMGFLEERIRYSMVSRPRRFFRILSLWNRGGYRYFLGWKSFLKDMICP